MISDEYRKLNAELHRTNRDYGTSGAFYKDMIKVEEGETVLDYGCGKGTLYIPGIRQYDPAIPGLDFPPAPAHVVICTDVLEHVEPEHLDAVLQDLGRVTIKRLFVSVHTGKAKKTLSDGRNAHLIQKDADWWKQTLERYFQVESVPHETHFVAWCR